MSIISQLAAIACFRAGPDDLPVSSRLLAAAAAADILVTAAGRAHLAGMGAVLLYATISTVLALVFSHLLLYLRSLTARFWQTATALLGVDALIGLIALPLWLSLDPPAAQGGMIQTTAPVVLGLGAITIWKIAAVARILSRALEQRPLAGALIALAYVFVTTGVAF